MWMIQRVEPYLINISKLIFLFSTYVLLNIIIIQLIPRNLLLQEGNDAHTGIIVYHCLFFASFFYDLLHSKKINKNVFIPGYASKFTCFSMLLSF